MATCAVTVISRRLRATLCLMLVASACGSAAAKGRSDDVISSQSVPWSAALATVDGLVVTLHFTGGREYDPG